MRWRKALRRPFVELDAEIEREAGISLSEIFLLYGQAGYRRIERRCLERIINSQEDIVLTVGGGIVSEPETYNLLLLNCYTVWIKAAPEEHMSRVMAQGDTRPMAGHAEAMADLKRILASRESLYGKADAVRGHLRAQTLKESLAGLRRAVARNADASDHEHGSSGNLTAAGEHARRVTFDTHPDRYRHWKLSFDGAVATLVDGRERGWRHASGLQTQAEFVRPGRRHRAARRPAAHPLRASRSAHAWC